MGFKPNSCCGCARADAAYLVRYPRAAGRIARRMAPFGVVRRHHRRHHRQSHAYRRHGDFGHYLGCTDRRDQRKKPPMQPKTP